MKQSHLKWPLVAMAGITALSVQVDARADGIFEALMPGFNPGWLPSRGDGVSIYGTVDEYIDHLQSGSTSVNRVSSGAAWTSKFGIFGHESLGGGTSAAFVLESGFNANNGTMQESGTLFNRQATIALANPIWGSVSMGKQFGVGLQLFVDPFLENGKISSMTYLSGVSDLGKGSSTIEGRVNNSVIYSTPSFGGVTAQMLFALKGDQDEGRTQNRGLNLTYKYQHLYLVGSFNQTWCDPAAGTCTDPSVRTDAVGAAAIYDMGRYTLSTSYQLFDPRRDGNYLASVYSAGAAAQFGHNLVRMIAVYRHTTQEGNHALSVTLGNDYFLSKRTALYVRAAFVKNGPTSSQTMDYTTGSPTPLPGVTVTDIAVGIYHNF